MAVCAWAVLCRKSVVDKKENSLSMFEVMENISFDDNAPPEDAYKDKAVIIGSGGEAAHFVSLWWRDEKQTPEAINARFSVVSPAGKSIYSKEFEIALESHERARHVFRMPGFFYQGPGRYLYRMEVRKKAKTRVRWEVVAEVPVNVGLPAEKYEPVS
jgi:hypothetical protein